MDEINNRKKQKKQFYWVVALLASCMFSIVLIEGGSGDDDEDSTRWFLWTIVSVGVFYGMLSPKGTARKAFRAGCLTYLVLLFVIGLFFCDASNPRKLIGLSWAVLNYIVFEVACAPLFDNKKRFGPWA